jgi:hypothetical protein
LCRENPDIAQNINTRKSQKRGTLKTARGSLVRRKRNLKRKVDIRMAKVARKLRGLGWIMNHFRKVVMLQAEVGGGQTLFTLKN